MNVSSIGLQIKEKIRCVVYFPRTCETTSTCEAEWLLFAFEITLAFTKFVQQ